jgi:predicted nucleic acid-binding protein
LFGSIRWIERTSPGGVTSGHADPRRKRPDRLLDSADGHHAHAVDDVDAADSAGHDLLAPASAYSEALVPFARAGRITDAREALAAMGITIAPLDQPTAERAAQLRAQHDALRLPDAIVLATATARQARLLSYDDRLAKLAGTRGPDPARLGPDDG